MTNISTQILMIWNSFFCIRCMHELLVSINTTHDLDEDSEVRRTERASSIHSSEVDGGDSTCSKRSVSVWSIS